MMWTIMDNAAVILAYSGLCFMNNVIFSSCCKTKLHMFMWLHCCLECRNDVSVPWTIKPKRRFTVTVMV